MKLKSVELIGFKSFAKKTKLNFPSGITEIVGPNGSGKSNIIEAIRWALGEQSAKNLRSSRMTDVIFSGSQSHAALNRAKVTLVFDNRDHFIDVNYDEIRVSRTVFRDGTNNYYLNGKPCRLRDIQDLFMNTGIGNGSFSIISQGKVAQIFKSKPVDRRFIIETVAGIYKYRSQKEVAAKKLTHVDANLTRISDLTYELKRRLQGLGQERRTAKQYLAKKQRANRLDVMRLTVRFNRLRYKLRRSRDASHNVGTSAVRVKQLITVLQKKSELAHQHLSHALKCYNQAQEQILKRSQKLDNLTNQNSLNQQKLTFWRQQIEQSQVNLTKTRQQIDKLRTDQKVLKRKAKTAKDDVDRLIKVIAQLNGKRGPQIVKQQRSNVTQLRSDYVKLVKRSAQIKGQIENLHQATQQRKRQTFHLKSQVNDVQKLADQAKDSLNSVKQNIADLKQGLIKLNRRSAKFDDHYQRATRQFQRVQHQYHAHERKRQIDQVRLNGLKRISARHSNLYNGPRNLLVHQDRFTGIFGPVAKFLDVSNADIQAIETTLRSQLQQIIVDNVQTAKAIVRFMSFRHLGRVTLLPINAVSKRWINPAIVNQCRLIPGFIDVASNLVKMPRRFLNVKLHLLGNVLITKDISSAVQVSRSVHRRYRVVTLDGNVINSGGAITGGHGRYRYHGLLSQRAKADQCRAVVTKLDRMIEQDRNKGIRIGKRLNSIKLKDQSVQKRLNKIHQQLAVKVNLGTRLSAESNNYLNILGRRRKSLNVGNDHQVTSVTLRRKQKQVEGRLTKVHRKLISERESLTHQSMITQRYGEKIHGYRERLIKIQDQEARFNRESKNNGTMLTQRSYDITELNNKITRLKRLIQDQTHHVQSNETLKNLSKTIDQMTAKKIHGHSLVEQNQRSLSRLRTRLSKAQDRSITLRNRANRGRLAIHDLGRKLHEVTEVLFRKYRIDVTKGEVPKPNASLYEISSELYNVQKQLRRIGPVNVNSIDQFKKVDHRYQFLSKQINDLVTSKKQLATTMDQMNSKIKIRFKKTFDQINQAFKLTYSQIFKGGRAKLTLVDPKHLLTTGVNIMAQPPGKRYRNMELLSGGERALTAIALLFAILRIKPAPFCILDEAESALDAVNIDRFGDYMQRLEAKTQFIVITHRKTTMLFADHLYGVTMQDSGISKIISVNLKKAKTEG